MFLSVLNLTKNFLRLLIRTEIYIITEESSCITFKVCCSIKQIHGILLPSIAGSVGKICQVRVRDAFSIGKDSPGYFQRYRLSTDLGFHSQSFTEPIDLDLFTTLRTLLSVGYYNPSVRITTQLLTPFILCALILYMNGGTYSLMSTLNDRFFEDLFMAILFTLRLYVRNLVKGNCGKNIYFFVLMYDLRFEPEPYV